MALLGDLKAWDRRLGERAPVAQASVAQNVGSPMRSSALLASTQRPSLLLAVCYLLGRVSRSASPVAVGDVFPGEYISCTLTTRA
jgi:hypothetical protein